MVNSSHHHNCFKNSTTTKKKKKKRVEIKWGIVSSNTIADGDNSILSVDDWNE